VTRNPRDIVAEGIDRFGRGREAVMQLLIKVDEELNWVPEEAIVQIAEETGSSIADIYGVVSFYSFFSTKPRGRNIVRVCSTISCAMQGQGEVLEAIMDELEIQVGETTADGRATLETTACLGLCDQAPAMLVNGTAHTRLTPQMVRDIIADMK